MENLLFLGVPILKHIRVPRSDGGLEVYVLGNHQGRQVLSPNVSGNGNNPHVH